MTVRPHSILLEVEALSALAAGRRSMQVWATVARRTDSVLYASTLTLVEVTDGTARDARLRSVVKAVRLVPVTVHIGYQAGALRASAQAGRRKPRDLAVDAVVAATALTLPAPTIVLTSDPNDLERLLTGTAVRVERV